MLEMAEDAPEFEDWLAQQPEGTSYDEYDRQFLDIRYLAEISKWASRLCV